MTETTHKRDARLWKRPLPDAFSATVQPPNLRNIKPEDVPALGALLFDAFLGTLDDADKPKFNTHQRRRLF
jgi:hypothetical protein